MSFGNTSSTRWRGRAIAVAGIAAAATVGGIALATAAQAANPTAPTLTVTAPAQIVNTAVTPVSDGLTIRVNNTAAGNAAITGSLSVTIGGITALPCSDITLTPDTTGPTSVTPALSPALASPTGTTPCTFTAAGFTQAQNSDVTYNYDISVIAPAVVGTLTTQASLDDVVSAGPPPVTVTTTSNTASTALVNPTSATPGAPAFSSTPVPPATVYHTYSFQETSSLGSPAATWTAFGTDATPNSSGIYTTAFTRTASTCVNVSATVCDTAIDLNDGFYFDTVTGKITTDYFDGVLDSTDWQPAIQWTLIANNGVGGATNTTTIPGVGAGSTTRPTPAIAQHDVDSSPFTLPILFSDVSQGNSFAAEIYKLSTDNVINGYADGTFRPTLAVSRQAFAAFLGRELGLGGTTCNPFFNPSTFSDVPNSSPFCSLIQTLASRGIINGYSDGTFHPAASITRQAMAAMLYRAHAYALTGTASDASCTTPIPFSDVSASNPFCGDIEWMASNHYANGYADGGYHPTGVASRQATAAFLFRIYGH